MCPRDSWTFLPVATLYAVLGKEFELERHCAGTS